MDGKGRRYLIEPQTRSSESPDSHSGKVEVRTAAFNCKVQQQTKGPSKVHLNVESKKQETKRNFGFFHVELKTKRSPDRK
jgi:hypothetical protein